MERISILRVQTVILLTVLCLALSPLAVQVSAQTPGAADSQGSPAEVPTSPAEVPPPPAEQPPPPAEEPPPPAEQPPPPAEEPPPPADNPPPADDPGDTPDDGSETEAPTDEPKEDPANEGTEESTEEAGNDGASTPDAEVEDDSEPATPTPTEEVIVPDELQVVGDVNITIAPGEYRDVTIRYTIGSDREKTEMSANLTAPGGESLEDWTLVPWQRADLDDNPEDANRHLKARIDFADSVDNGDVYETTWRVTAPAHIEKPVNVRLHLSTKIHREDGVTDGVIKNDLVNFNATASVHTPALNCDEVIAEDVDNSWNCAFDTTHPDDDVVITATADVPEGWELALDDVELINEPLALSADAIATDSFTLAATYPIGCPDIGATFSTSVSLNMTYPSGEVSEIDAELPLVFERPTPRFEITSFEFDDMDLTQTLSTTGRMAVSYDDVPCAWQATMNLTDLESDMYTIPADFIQIQKVDGLADANFVLIDGSVSITSAESNQRETAGEFTIHFTIDLPFQIPPGAYRIGVTTQFSWADQN